MTERGREDFIFREETGKRYDTCDGKTADQECDVGHRHMLAQTVHGCVVVRTDSMNQCTGAKEKQRLEHGVGEQVEHTGHITQPMMEFRTCHTQRHHHKRNLRNGGECQHTFDVNLRTSHHRGIQCRQGTHYHDNIHCRSLHQIKREQAGYQVDTGHNHRSGMDKCRHRGGAFHCIGQPDVQRHHRRLTHTTHENQHKRPGQH